jgi:hypothetical protein
MTKTAAISGIDRHTQDGVSELTGTKSTSQAERPENSNERTTFPASASMTPDYDVMAWRLGGVAHGDRLRIIKLMRDGKARSPKAMAAALELPLGVTSYHVRFMAERDLLTLDHAEPRRGALEHFYVLSKHGMDVKKVLKL